LLKKKLNILFLVARFPYPLVGGDKLKPYYVIKHLAENHNVTVISFNEGNRTSNEDINEVRKLGVNLIVVPFNPAKQFISGTSKMLTKLPLEVTYYYNRQFQQETDNVIKEKNIDLIFSFMQKTSEYVLNYPHKKVLIQDDCRTLYYGRSAKESPNPFQKIIRTIEYKKGYYYEPYITDKFDIVSFVSQEDIDGAYANKKCNKYRIITNGVDLNRLDSPKDNSHRKDVIFGGRLDVLANQLSLDRVIKNIMPFIKNELHDIKLNVVGAYPPEYLKQMHNKEIILHANVPDLKPFLHNAALFIHPHYGGSGIQNKVLEAMATGCPVVTTPSGNQGIHGEHKKEVMLGQNDKELAKHAINVLKDSYLADNLSKNARKLIEDTHSWDAVYKQIDDVIDELFR
jgi:glycosyltransferase involved in cell wall biosynthesis